MPPSVRRAGPADAPVIVAFNLRLAEEGGAVVGQLMLTKEWSDWRNGWLWWIQSAYVRQDARRRGIFRALYDHVRRAAENDPEVIGLRLYMEQDNHAARQTYLRLGMKPTSYVVFEQFPL